MRLEGASQVPTTPEVLGGEKAPWLARLAPQPDRHGWKEPGENGDRILIR